MLKFIGISSLSTLVLAVPHMAFGARNLLDLLVWVNTFLNGLIGIIITIAIIVFFWGLVRYLTDVGEAKHDGLIMIFYALIALFVMVSVWGLLRMLQVTFDVGNGAPIQVQTAPLR